MIRAIAAIDSKGVAQGSILEPRIFSGALHRVVERRPEFHGVAFRDVARKSDDRAGAAVGADLTFADVEVSFQLGGQFRSS